jgi:hypothetical protein
MTDEENPIRKMFDDLERQKLFKGVKHYRLDDNHQVVPCSMYESMMFQIDPQSRVVDQTVLPNGSRVSTVFLGGLMVFNDRPPRLFETMIFGGPQSGYQRTYETWEQAVRGHEAAILLAQD